MTVCPRCAHAAPEGARFCPACGGRLGGAEPARFASPGAYTPRTWIERMEGEEPGTISGPSDF